LLRNQNSEESTKLALIEDDIGQSAELQVVSKPEDEAEFEMHTNRDFNHCFDQDVVTCGAL
jgi:hypothetical protein